MRQDEAMIMSAYLVILFLGGSHCRHLNTQSSDVDSGHYGRIEPTDIAISDCGHTAA